MRALPHYELVQPFDTSMCALRLPRSLASSARPELGPRPRPGLAVCSWRRLRAALLEI
jgi:hypothetical protein